MTFGASVVFLSSQKFSDNSPLNIYIRQRYVITKIPAFYIISHCIADSLHMLDK